MPKYPCSDIDLFADECLRDPYPAYAELRRLGGAVWLERYDIWALPRYETAFTVLRDHARFSSQAQGVGFTPLPPGTITSTLTSDPPLHGKLRRVVAAQLTPAAVQKLEERINDAALALIEGLTQAGRFEAMTQLARHLPLTIVTELVGVPSALGEKMLEYSEARGNTFGPPELQRTKEGFARIEQVRSLVDFVGKRENLIEGSMAAAVYAAADRGEIEPERAPVLMRDYIGPSLDTTVAGTGNLVWLLGKNPDQWELLRNDPDLAPNAVDEALRLESPIQYFCRTAVSDVTLDGADIKQGERVLVMYASANRDDRRWEEPDRMNIHRQGLPAHLAFGLGIHSCAGRVLAKTEINAICRAMVTHMARFEIEHEERSLNNVFRAFKSLRINATPSSARN